jgi:hypothetical protein
VTFNVEAISNETWNSTFTITVNAPALMIGNLLVDDSATGDGDGTLDPGETANILIESSNQGHIVCFDVEGNLSTTSPFITINNTVYTITELPAGESFNASFEVTADAQAPLGTSIDLNYQLASYEYQATQAFVITVGIIDEDFETGNFSKYDWSFSGNEPWTISEQNPYEGAYCVRSGIIADNQTSEMTVTFEVLADDSISFFRKVSSELSYDFLQFFIDDVKMGEWSGELNWERVAFPVTTGNHVFKWIYSKDVYVTGGADAAYIDYIVFPPVLIPVGIEENTANNSWLVFPNPFKDILTIDYLLEKTTAVKISLVNLSGRELMILENTPSEQAGKHTVNLSGYGLKPGVYFIRLETEASTDIRKVILL